MAHTHEYDCIVCGAHFDSMEELARHDSAVHEPKVDVARDASEPIGTEHRRADAGDDDASRRETPGDT